MKLYLLLLLGLVLIPLSVWAQDPGSPDTIYFEAGGLHSADGETLYVLAGTFPADVEVDVMVWTDNNVAGVTMPLIDECYNISTMPTYLDSMKNQWYDATFPPAGTTYYYWAEGGLLENFNIINLNLYGTTTPTPPNFLIGGVHFNGSFPPPGGKLAHLVFTVSDTGCLCLDTIAAFYPGGATPSFTTTPAPHKNYVPIIKDKCFTVDVSYLTDTLFVIAYSPVDLIVIDPIGDSIDIDFNTIPDATYDTTQDLNDDGDKDDIVTMSNRLVGDYLIQVVAEPGDTGEYTLGVRIDGSDMAIMAEDQPSPAFGGEPDSFTYDALWYLKGDLNSDWQIDLSDVIYLANYYLKGGPAPEPLESADVNCDTEIDLTDVILIAYYILKGQPFPC